MVAVHTLDFLVPVAGPQRPKDKVRPIGRRKQSEPVDPPVLANPVPGRHMIGMGVFGESRCLGLLGGEVTLLLFGELEEPSCRFPVRLGQTNTTSLLIVYQVERYEDAHFIEELRQRQSR